MPIEEVLNYLRARPFVPFRVCLLDGTVYEVHHPELLLPGARSLTIGLNADPTQPVYEPGRIVTVSLLAVSRLEPLPQAQPAGNGQGKG